MFFLVLLSGCTQVAFYEKEHFSHHVMQFESDSSEAHFEQKVLFSKEGSVGGIGAGAGGGCGCY